MPGCLPQVDGGGCGRGLISLAQCSSCTGAALRCSRPALRCSRRSCSAPLHAAAEVPGPLSRAGRLPGETRPSVRDAAGMLPGGEEGVAGWKKWGPAGSDVWQSLLAPRALWARDPPAGLQSWLASARRHPRLMLGIHKSQHYSVSGERDVKDPVLGLCAVLFLF